jgi:hypothetical protein
VDAHPHPESHSLLAEVASASGDDALYVRESKLLAL